MKKSENIIKFEEAMKNNEEKQKDYESALKKIAAAKDAKSNGELVSRAAKEVGFDLTAEECDLVFAEKQEMADDELDKVAGGWCWTSHGCHVVISHSEEIDETEDCFNEYICFNSYFLKTKN